MATLSMYLTLTEEMGAKMILSEDIGAAICVIIAWLLGIGVGYCRAKELESKKHKPK